VAVTVAEQDRTTPFAGLPSTSRLLHPAGPGGSSTLAAHVEQHGALPGVFGNQLIEIIEASGLTGRGGAAFPVARKLRAVASQSGPAIVVGNASEGEPAAFKDKTLLARNPHVVLDGLTLAARATGATQAYLYVHDDKRLIDVVRRAILERRAARIDQPSIEFVVAPDRFIAGEESAVVAVLEGRGPVPRAKPPRVFECGVYGRPTLVQNAETLAHIALIARYGASWFRALGTTDEPGTMLCSVSGCVRQPSVIEAAIGTPIRQVFDAAGGLTEPVQAVLFGGYHGGWLRAADVVPLSLSNADLRPRGAALGAGVLVALPASVCGLAEAARVMLYLAEESAGQCGPCVHGLPRLADMFDRIAVPHRSGRGERASREIDRAIELLKGRGACNHPDGGVRFAISSLGAFREELEHHARGRCTATSGHEVLPTPRGW
jgi:NADH:ubiquinone oxidoreductase subunit F (NADH-binding)